MTVTRGTTNGNARGSNVARQRRREYLLATYAADVHIVRLTWHDGGPHGLPNVELLYPSSPEAETWWTTADAHNSAVATIELLPTCRCYRCGKLLADLDKDHPNHITVDRIKPGKQGGTYRRDNIRPACSGCNSETGGALRSTPTRTAKAPRKPAPRRGDLEAQDDPTDAVQGESLTTVG